MKFAICKRGWLLFRGREKDFALTKMTTYTKI